MRNDRTTEKMLAGLGTGQSRSELLAGLGHASSGGHSSAHTLPGSQRYNALVDPLVRAVTAGSGGGAGGSGGGSTQVNQTTQDLLRQITSANQVLTGLKTVTQSQVDGMTQNTQALVQSTVAKVTGGSSALGSIGGIASGLLGGGLGGLSPILSGLIGLFGGGSSAPPPLLPFQLPPSVQFQGGIDGGGNGGVGAADYGQNGTPRAVGSSSASSSSPQVTIQVNAMDTQSFLNRSSDIAEAVRQALLHSNSLNDVVSGI